MRSFATIALLVAFTLITYSSTNSLVMGEATIYERCLYPTMVIYDPEAKTGGSAFVVRSTRDGDKYKNFLITAYHAVESDGPFYVKHVKYRNLSEPYADRDYPLFVYAMNPKDDLAVCVFVSDDEMPVAEMDFDHRIFMGSKIFHVGFGLMDDARIDRGEVTQPLTFRPETFKGAIRTNAYTIVGDSGGPLFLENSHKVIGVCRAVRNLDKQLLTHQSYFTDIKAVKSWNESLDNALAPIYNHKEKMPVLPFLKLGLQKYKFAIPQ